MTRNLAALSLVVLLAACARGPNSSSSQPAHKAAAKIEDSFRIEIKPVGEIKQPQPLQKAPGHSAAPVQAEETPQQIERPLDEEQVTEVKAPPAPETPVTLNLPPPPPAATLTTAIGLSDKRTIVLKRSALDNEFLFSGLLVQDNSSFPITYMKARIVRFIERDGQLIMLESKAGQFLNLTLSPETILATFPIVSSSAQDIAFNFTEGFSRLYYYSQEMPTPDGRRDGGLRAANLGLNITSSYINDARMQENQLVIHQVLAATSRPSSGIAVNFSFENTIFIEPYNPDPNFVKRDTSREKRVGFFQTDRIYQDNGTAIQYAQHIGPKPMHIYLSANTPKEAVEPVSKALTYWNRVFGEEKIKVSMAEPGDARNMKYDHFVQWSSNEHTSFAYANSLVDPRTGEVLKSIIYIPSVALTNGLSHARAMDRLNRGCISVANFTGQDTCAISEPAEVASEVAIDSKLVKQATESRIYELAAHEMGHILGLRHNFAGSLAATYSGLMNESIERYYAKELKAPNGVYPSSSVMDYLPGMHRMILGDFIRDTNSALSYDYQAIRFLYYDEPIDAKTIPPYCTDEDKGTYVDCNDDDTGRDYAELAVANYERRLRALPNAFIGHFIGPLTDQEMNEADPAKIVVDVNKNFIEPLFESRKILSGMFDEKTKELSIYRNYLKVDLTTESQIKAEKDLKRWQSIVRLGGMKRVFSIPSSREILNLKERARRLLHSPQYATGFDSLGRPYALTGEQMTEIESQIDPVFNAIAAKIESTAIKSVLQIVPTVGPRMRSLVVDNYKALLQNLIFTQDPSGAVLQDTIRSKNYLDRGRYVGISVAVPSRKYRKQTALTALTYVAKTAPLTIGERKALLNDLDQQIQAHVHRTLRGVKLKDVDKSRISPTLRQWVETFEAFDKALK